MNSTFINVQGRGTISLPASARKRYRLDEPGAQLEVIELDDQIVLRPKLPVDASQAWFWTSDWQAGERQADLEAANREGDTFDTEEEFLASLKN